MMLCRGSTLVEYNPAPLPCAKCAKGNFEELCVTTKRTQDGMGLLHGEIELSYLTHTDGWYRDAVSRDQQDLPLHAQSLLSHLCNNWRQTDIKHDLPADFMRPALTHNFSTKALWLTLLSSSLCCLISCVICALCCSMSPCTFFHDPESHLASLPFVTAPS